MTYTDNLLLTGAGFTANFGGFLGKEMWSKIFNNPKLNEIPKVKAELKKSFDFEDIYSRIFENRPSFEEKEIKIFEDVVNEVYLAMDRAIRNSTTGEHFGFHPSDLRKFLEFFSQTRSSVSAACFTLNQDLFLERFMNWQPLVPVSMRFNQSGNGIIDTTDLDSRSLKTLPTLGELDDVKGRLTSEFVYIKLHGSQKWVSSDSSDTKVIGINKKESIDKIPLLKWYFELFQDALFRPNVKLVSIGYSFRDEHINEIRVKAILDHGLKIYIISTEDPSSFQFRLTNKYPSGSVVNDADEKHRPIWDAVDGYFPYKLNSVFPYDQTQTPEKAEIFGALGISP